MFNILAKDISKETDPSEVFGIFLCEEIKWQALHQKMNLHECKMLSAVDVLHVTASSNQAHVLKMDGILTPTSVAGWALDKVPKLLHSQNIFLHPSSLCSSYFAPAASFHPCSSCSSWLSLVAQKMQIAISSKREQTVGLRLSWLELGLACLSCDSNCLAAR